MLRQQPNLGEVNYWALSAGSFRALEMFLFKLHAPRPFNPTDWGRGRNWAWWYKSR